MNKESTIDEKTFYNLSNEVNNILVKFTTVKKELFFGINKKLYKKNDNPSPKTYFISYI